MVWRKYFLSTFSLKMFVLSDSLFVTQRLNGLNNAIHSFFEMHRWIILQNNYRAETFSSDYCSIYKEKHKHCGKVFIYLFLSFMAHFVNRWIGWTGHFGSTGRLCYLLIAQFSVWFPASDFKVFFSNFRHRTPTALDAYTSALHGRVSLHEFLSTLNETKT